MSRADSQPRGGGAPAMGEARQILVVSGDHAWNVTGETAAPTPVALIERQLQLWTTPHGVIKAAMANNATVQGRTISLRRPRALQGQGHARRPEPRREGRGRVLERGGRRHAGGGDVFGLPGLRRGEVPHEDPPVGRRVSLVRRDRGRSPAQRRRRHPGAGQHSPGGQSLRPGYLPGRSRGRVVPDRRQPSQRGHRDEGLRDRGGGARSTRTARRPSSPRSGSSCRTSPFATWSPAITISITPAVSAASPRRA